VFNETVRQYLQTLERVRVDFRIGIGCKVAVWVSCSKATISSNIAPPRISEGRVLTGGTRGNGSVVLVGFVEGIVGEGVKDVC
jgi:hypothetical protein